MSCKDAEQFQRDTLSRPEIFGGIPLFALAIPAPGQYREGHLAPNGTRFVCGAVEAMLFASCL
jgi:hypothetical protein